MEARLFYGAVGGFCAGVAAALLWVPGFEAALWLSAAALAAALCWRACHTRQARYWLVGSVVCLAAAAGAFRVGIMHVPAPPPTGDVFQGTVVREPDRREATQHLTLALHSHEAKVLVYTEPYRAIEYGDVVRVQGELATPEAFATPLGRTFHYPEYLLSKGIAYVMYYPTMEVVDERAANPLLGYLYTFKQQFLRGVNAALPEPAAGLGAGLLLGEKRALGEEWEQIFRDTGIIHIVVLSGYNVMLVISFVTLCVARIAGVRVQVWVSLLAIVLFVLLVGPSPTVVRAALMASLLLIACAVGATYLVLRALCAAAVLMLAHTPLLLLFDPGFQLSFLATAGLIFFVPILYQHLSWVPRAYGARALCAATIAAQLAVLPLLAYQIGHVSVVSVFVNVLVLPAVPVAMLLTALTGAAAFASGTLASLVALPAYAVLHYILTTAALFAQAPFAAATLPSVPWWSLLLGYGALGALCFAHYRTHTTEAAIGRWCIEAEESCAVAQGEEQPRVVST